MERTDGSRMALVVGSYPTGRNHCVSLGLVLGHWRPLLAWFTDVWHAISSRQRPPPPLKLSSESLGSPLGSSVNRKEGWQEKRGRKEGEAPSAAPPRCSVHLISCGFAGNRPRIMCIRQQDCNNEPFLCSPILMLERICDNRPDPELNQHLSVRSGLPKSTLG